MTRKQMLSFCLAFLLTIKFSTAHSQCDDKLGYDQQGSLVSSKPLKGYMSEKDTAIRMALMAALVKTELTNGLSLKGLVGENFTIDQTTRVKISFTDGTSITLVDYLNQPNIPSSNKGNTIGFFVSVITDKYSLLLLKTKPIKKVQVTGSLLDATTYLVDPMVAIDFMLAQECLQGYL